MKLQSFVMFILWSSTATKVLLFEISSTNPHELNSNQSSYYLEADTNSNQIDPKEELKRTQRSFLKKFWKDSGLQDLFSDEGCVNCCNNNNYNAGDGDIYETPPTSSYIPYFQQIPPLSPLQPFDPLRIFQPFLAPMNFNTNGLNEAGYINSYDKANIPKKYEGENSNVFNNNYEEGYSNKNSGTSEVTESRNIHKHKAKENNEYSPDKSNNNEPIYTVENATIYNGNSSDKNTYQKIDIWPVDDIDAYQKSKATQAKQTYPSLNGSSGSIVYQPIIYLSPRYQVAPPMFNSAHNSYQNCEESNQHYPNVKTQPKVYTTEKEEQKSNLPSYDNFKEGPNTKVSYSDQYLPCGVSPYGTLLSNKIQPSEEYLNPYSHKSFVPEYTPPPLALLSSLSSTYGMESQCSDTKVTPSDIAIYTLVTQIPCTFAPSKTRALNANPYSYLNKINDLYKKPTSPIIMTEADQPYRNCPELFTDYLNQGTYNQNIAKGNTFIRAQFISC